MKNESLLMVLDRIESDAVQILPEFSENVSPRDSVDAAAMITKIKRSLEKIEKDLKTNIIANARNGELHGGTFRALIVETAGRATIDAARLKAERPDIVAEYSKISGPIRSVRFTI